MQVKAWFGIFTLDNDRITDAELFRKDLDAIANLLVKESLLLRGRIAGSDIRDLAIEYGFVTSREEYDSLLHELNIRLVKEQMAQAVTQDRQIIAAVEAIDDINDTANILAERLREWYLMFNETGLQGGELAKHIFKSEEPELKTMQGLAGSVIGLYEARLSIEEYLKEGMPPIV